MPVTKSRRRSRRRLKPAERREMIRLVLEEGRSVNSVARQFGTCWPTVKNWVNKAQSLETQSSDSAKTLITKAVLNPVGGYRFISDEKKAEALRLVLEDGMSAFAAGTRTGIAHTTISRWLRETRRDNQGASPVQQKATTDPCMDGQSVEPAQEQPSGDQLFTEMPFDDRSTDGVAEEVIRLREQVTDLRVERDFLRLVVMHFVAPAMAAAGDLKITFSAE